MESTSGHTLANDDGKVTRPAQKTPVWRIAWLGITLSALLWFAPSAYFEKIQQYHEVELQTGSMSQSDYDETLTRNTGFLMASRLCASVLMLGSLIYLLSHVERRRGTLNTDIR